MTFAFFKVLEDIKYNFTCKQIIGQINNYLSNNNYPQIPTLSFTKESLLNELILGDNVKPNINIYLEGDAWCNTESTWNLLNMNNNKLIFETDKKFYCKNEKINFRIKLDKGNYLLILKDNYGDGGVSGNIKYIENDTVIKNFNFSKGTYQSINFSVGEENVIDLKNKIKIECSCDYYGISESKWNIIDSFGTKLFVEDIKFTESNEKIIKYINIEPGKYKFRCMDSYGDGGISAIITYNNSQILNFNWNNLDWSTENGYLKDYEFRV